MQFAQTANASVALPGLSVLHHFFKKIKNRDKLKKSNNCKIYKNDEIKEKNVSKNPKFRTFPNGTPLQRRSIAYDPKGVLGPRKGHIKATHIRDEADGGGPACK